MPSDDFLAEVLAGEARALIKALKDSPMLVGLMLAPDPRHSGHMIRVVFSRPPAWYMEIYGRRGRKTFKRHRFMAALERVARGLPARGSYQVEVLEWLKNGGAENVNLLQ